ncbi:hypothetical protein [Nocardia asteroides]|uniref:hypothetical protein n=1 Tax=Nocardia asteroides TaxID=1824 RepID=UPI001E525E83|nr:hypothetical protein [Nocardia asteroides]UGT63513.1 hypothetical protein LTT61_09455 [Nocardia asteroides]
MPGTRKVPALLAPAVGVTALVACTVALLPLTVQAAEPPCGVSGADYQGVTYRVETSAAEPTGEFTLDQETAALRTGTGALHGSWSTVAAGEAGFALRVRLDTDQHGNPAGTALDLRVTGCRADGRVTALAGDQTLPDGTVRPVSAEAAES